jgi:hypothetical protein
MPNNEPEAGGRNEDARKTYSAQDVRQGYIVLRTPLRRWVFFGGLAGLVLLGLVFGVALQA